MTPLEIEGREPIEGTPEELARHWLGLDQRPDIVLELHPRIVEAFASTPPLVEGFIACGGRDDITDHDRATINQFAAFLRGVGQAQREKAAAVEKQKEDARG